MASSGSSPESTRPHRRRELGRTSRSRDTRPRTHPEEVDYGDEENNPLPSINPPPGTEIARPRPTTTFRHRHGRFCSPDHHLTSNRFRPTFNTTSSPVSLPSTTFHSRFSTHSTNTSYWSTLSTTTRSSTSSPTSTLSLSCHRPTTSQSIFTTSATQTTTFLP